jgi:hypothetical protein
VRVPGCSGIPGTVIASERVAPEPQALFAVTEIFPLVEPTVTVMELEVELPVHPAGIFQV